MTKLRLTRDRKDCKKEYIKKSEIFQKNIQKFKQQVGGVKFK